MALSIGTPTTAAVATVATGIRPASRVEHAALFAAAVLFASGVVHLGILVVGDDSWIGPLSWRKAATFGMSFGLTLAAVTFAGRLLPVSRTWELLLGVFTAACVVETALVTVQAWRHVPSHFNFETSTDTAVAFTLAAGGAVLVLCGLGFTTVAIRSVAAPPMLLALRASFVALLLGFGVGAAMVAKGVRLARGGQPELAYATAGQLKPLHALLLHGILLLVPIAWAGAHQNLAAGHQLLLVRVSVVTYAVAVCAVAWSVL
jgi:hypothetical protein